MAISLRLATRIFRKVLFIDITAQIVSGIAQLIILGGLTRKPTCAYCDLTAENIFKAEVHLKPEFQVLLGPWHQYEFERR